MTLANPTVAAPAGQASSGAPVGGTRVGRYRKRPVEIDAIRYDGMNSDEIALWASTSAADIVRRTEHWLGACGLDSHAANRDLLITTLEDGSVGSAQVEHIASPGDWIVRGIEGEFYPVKDTEFRATYEAVAL